MVFTAKYLYTMQFGGAARGGPVYMRQQGIENVLNWRDDMVGHYCIMLSNGIDLT